MLEPHDLQVNHQVEELALDDLPGIKAPWHLDSQVCERQASKTC